MLKQTLLFLFPLPNQLQFRHKINALKRHNLRLQEEFEKHIKRHKNREINVISQERGSCKVAREEDRISSEKNDDCDDKHGDPSDVWLEGRLVWKCWKYM